MLKKWPRLTLFLLVALALVIAPATVTATEFTDEFPNMESWTIYRGQENVDQIMMDTRFGRPPPSLNLPPAGSPLTPDPPGFCDNVTSIYLSNPDTSHLSNFTLSFWIYFNDDAGRAIVTFRMQDDRNFYALLLSDTRDWNSSIVKFSNDNFMVLAQKGPAIFAPRTWSHVKLDVQGQVFRLYKDNDYQPILVATDGEWAAGRTLGIGLYNGFDHFYFHVDSLDLSTPEVLYYVRVFTQTSTITETYRTAITETFQTSITQTSTEVMTSFSTTTTTRTQEIPHLVVVDVTSSTTTFVGVLTPILDWQTSLFVLLAGVAVGYWGKHRGRPLVAVVFGSVIASVIIALFQAHAPWGMSAAGIFALAILFGIIAESIRSSVGKEKDGETANDKETSAFSRCAAGVVI